MAMLTCLWNWFVDYSAALGRDRCGCPRSARGGIVCGLLGGEPGLEFGRRYRLDHDRPQSVGKIREFLGNVQVVLKAYAWTRAMGAEGIAQASDISVLGNNYMEKGLLAIRGVTRSHPDGKLPRLEMTRYSLETMKEETGVGVNDVQNRMADFGIDPIWSSHEPWLVPEPFTPEAGEMYGKEALDRWIAVLARISDEAYSTPEIVKTSPHNLPTHRLKPDETDDPSRRAMTWFTAFLSSLRFRIRYC